MIKTLFAAAVVATLGTGALAHSKSHHHHHHHTATTASGKQITVSCFRGPWNEVIIDRPNAIFIDSLVDVGYEYSTAHAIAYRICRDQALVGNESAMRSEMQRILRTQPARRRHGH